MCLCDIMSRAPSGGRGVNQIQRWSAVWTQWPFVQGRLMALLASSFFAENRRRRREKKKKQQKKKPMMTGSCNWNSFALKVRNSKIAAEEFVCYENRDSWGLSARLTDGPDDTSTHRHTYKYISEWNKINECLKIQSLQRHNLTQIQLYQSK